MCVEWKHKIKQKLALPPPNLLTNLKLESFSTLFNQITNKENQLTTVE